MNINMQKIKGFFIENKQSSKEPLNFTVWVFFLSGILCLISGENLDSLYLFITIIGGTGVFFKILSRILNNQPVFHNLFGGIINKG